MLSYSYIQRWGGVMRGKGQSHCDRPKVDYFSIKHVLEF